MLFENVSALCKERGISIRALEMATGLSNGTIGKWDVKDRSPRVNGVKAVAEFFGVSMEYLLGAEDRRVEDLSSKE